MNTAGIIRRVQSALGDSYEVYIDVADIVDWINEGQVEIARETKYRTALTTSTATVMRAGLAIADMLLLKRVYYNTTPLQLVSEEMLDRVFLGEAEDGEPYAYYMDGEEIYLYPRATASDTTVINIRYLDAPTDLASSASPLDIPVMYHTDLLNYCTMRAHEKNLNFRAAEVAQTKYVANLAQRKHEGTVQDDSFASMTPDRFDSDDWSYGYSG